MKLIAALLLSAFALAAVAVPTIGANPIITTPGGHDVCAPAAATAGAVTAFTNVNAGPAVDHNPLELLFVAC